MCGVKTDAQSELRGSARVAKIIDYFKSPSNLAYMYITVVAF